MYNEQDFAVTPASVFRLPRPLALTAAVAIIAHCECLWLVKWAVVTSDVYKGAIQPIGFITEPAGRLVRWFMFLPPQRGSKVDDAAVTFCGNINRALLLTFCAMMTVWPISIGMLFAVAGPHTKFGDLDSGASIPRIYLLLLQTAMSILTLPAFTVFWLARCGWEANQNAAS